jgi:hypothetical protein
VTLPARILPCRPGYSFALRGHVDPAFDTGRVARERVCTTVPRFPRLGPLEQRSPASSVLLRHYDFCSEYGITYGFALPPQLCVSSFIPLQRRQPQGVALFISPRASGPPRVGRFTGSPRFLGNPSCTFAPVSDPGRAGLASPFNGNPMLSPPVGTMRTPTMRSISGLNNAALVLAVYASSSASLHSHARLASGVTGLPATALTGLDLHQLDFNKRFR